MGVAPTPKWDPISLTHSQVLLGKNASCPWARHRSPEMQWFHGAFDTPALLLEGHMGVSQNGRLVGIQGRNRTVDFAESKVDQLTGVH